MDKFMNPFSPEYNDGAFYVLKGRFLMPLVGAKDGKTVSPVKVSVLIVAVCLVLVGLFVGTQFLIVNANYDVPYLNQLELGISQEDVLQRLKLQEDALVPVSQGVYAIADGCEYAGVSFDILLHFDNNSQLAGYEYTTALTADPKDAARSTAKVVNKLDLFFYDNHLHGDCLHMEKAALTEEFTAPYTLTYSRDLTPKKDETSSVASYLQALEASDAWEHKVAGYVVKKAGFYNDVNVTYDPDTQQLTLRLNYTIEADRKSA